MFYCFQKSISSVVAALIICGCASHSAIAFQQSALDTNSKVETVAFEISGAVTSKSEDRFEIKTDKGENFEILTADDTDFALRMTSPYFNTETREVVVNGKQLENGKYDRIKYPLPEGKLYLLAEFRSAGHRKRILSKSPWRLNNYLISDQEIEPVLPTGEGVLLSGELNLEKSELLINDKSWPIKLGFRGATLRGRYFEEIIAGETTVLVTGKEKGKIKTASTVIFMTR